MRRVGEITVDRDKVMTRSGQYPLNGNSAVWVRKVARKQYTKKGIALGFFAAGIATGGLGMLLCLPGYAFLFHETHQVVINTNGAEFVVQEFKAVAILKEPQKQAEELKDAIAAVIAESADEQV